MHLRIRLYDEPILRQKGKKIIKFDAELKKLTDDMIETMYTDGAYGLAAQQVGQALQVFVVDIAEIAKEFNDDLHVTLDGKKMHLELIMPLVVINPELMSMPCKEVSFEETCMSFGDDLVVLPILRPEFVHLKYQDLHGVVHEMQCGGILARCILHEFDHLEGILFIDRAKRSDLIRNERKFKQLKRATRDFLKSEEKKHGS